MTASVRSKLALASCALLSQHGFAQGIDNDWVIDSSFLHYAESDDRVTVNKLVLSVDGNVSTKDSVNLQLVYDTMSGATPTGLVSDPSASLDTVSGVSGGSFSSGGSGDGTLAEFDDTRLAAKMDWAHQYTRTLGTTYGAAISVENDYQSAGLSLKFDKDTDSRLTTFTAGLAGTFDTISRTGGKTPLPLSNTDQDDADVMVDSATRHTYEAIVGVSRILNVRTIAQFNMSLGMSAGYHTDPYKLVSVADPDTLAPRGPAIYESRPEERERRSLYGKIAHQLSGGNIVHLAYRHYEDDWEISSDTLEAKYHKKLSRGSYIEPSFRWYTQSEASFYTHYLDSSIYDSEDPSTLPEFVSADYRLDGIQSYTLGIKYGRPLFSGGKLRARAAYMSQSFDDGQFSELDAIVLQFSFKNTFQ